LLGPATVALAIPLVRELGRVRRLAVPLTVALLAGSLAAILSAVCIGWALGADRATLASLAPKSVTTPIGMALAQAIGGIPALTAAVAIGTGVVAAMSLGPMARLLRQRGQAALGLAAGVGGGGLGTAQAVLLGELAGAFGGLGLALNGLVTSILVPVLAGLWR
jgi:putative effector of murein hydrolase